MIKEKVKITIAGKIYDPFLEQCKEILKRIQQKDPGVKGEIKSFFQIEWGEYFRAIKSKFGGQFVTHTDSPLIYINESEYIGGPYAFLRWAGIHYSIKDSTSFIYYKNRCCKTLMQVTINNPAKAFCFMNIKYGAHQTVPVIYELYLDIAPLTCKNFIALCEGYEKKKGKYVGYTGTEMHRVVPQAFVQGGNIVRGKNNSIYGGKFPDETFVLSHDRVGLLGMAKQCDSPHSNECQFYITLAAPLKFMDKKYVIFGRVVQGFRIFKILEKQVVSNKKLPEKCRITDSGLYEHKKKRVKKPITSYDYTSKKSKKEKFDTETEEEIENPSKALATEKKPIPDASLL